MSEVQNWVIEAILPTPRTPEQQASEEAMIMKMTQDNPQLKDTFSPISIIGMDEAYGAFDERCPRRASYVARGGDWVHVLDDSIVDALRRKGDSTGPSLVGVAFMDALADEKNRKRAKEFWTVALEKVSTTLEAGWWKMSADALAGRVAGTKAREPEAANNPQGPTSAPSSEPQTEALQFLRADRSQESESERSSEGRNSPGSSQESEQPLGSGPQTFGQFLTQELEQRGLSDGDVARKSGGRVTRQNVGRLKKDKFKKKPHPETLIAIAQATGIAHHELLRWASKKVP